MSLFGRPAVPPEVQAREDAWNREKEECLKRFNEAVAAGKRGSYGLSQAIIARVKEGHGQKAADIAASELKKAIQREPKTKR
jgi:aryl-alcohol dehydrogenase-like predicted oxidoreductase